MVFLRLLIPIVIFGLLGCGQNDADLVIYSARTEALLKPLIAKYTEKTGKKVVYLTDKAGPLVQRLITEGKKSPADLLITVDAGNLAYAASRGLFRPIPDWTAFEAIPKQLMSAEGDWVGLSVRARTLVYHTDRVKASELSTYAQLADPKWKGRLALRTSQKVYNRSLIAMLINDLGENKTKKILKGWVQNLATDVFSSDTKVLEAIEAGQGDVGIINTYYYGRYLKTHPNTKLKLFWADQQGKGTHINVSGVGYLRHAPHKKNAIAFIKWLTTPEAQRILADMNMEYPANTSVKPSKFVLTWGTFKANTIPVSLYGELQADAIKLADKVGYK